MKTKRQIIVAAALSLIGTSATAQTDLTLLLKDGSELTGYISEQRPGDNLSITTERAVIYRRPQEVRSYIDHAIKAHDLSPQWQAWAKENGFITSDDDSFILTDIIYDYHTISNVRILEKGAKLRYIELGPNSYFVNIDSIVSITAPRRDPMMLSGINRQYQLKNGQTVTGQYVGEIPGKTLSLLTDKGYIEAVTTTDVVKDMRVKLNPNQSFIEQSDLIDIVTLNDGTRQRGVIFERNYEPQGSNKPSYLLMQCPDEQIVSINLNDISNYSKDPNPLYSPLTDIKLDSGQIAVNRMIIDKTTVAEENGIFEIKPDSTTATIAYTPVITIEMNAGKEIASTIKLLKAKKHKEEGKKKSETHYGFTFENIVKDAIIPKKASESVNGTTRLEYDLTVRGPGLYVLFDPTTSDCIFFYLTNE